MAFDDDNAEALRMNNLRALCGSLITGPRILPAKADNAHLAFFMLLQPDAYEFKAAQRFFAQLQSRIEQLLQVTVSVGISGALYGYEQAHTGYIEAIRAVQKRFFSGNQSVNQFIREEDLARDESLGADLGVMQETAQKLHLVLSYTDSVSLVKKTGLIFDDLTRHFWQDVEYIKSSSIILFILCIREALGKDARQMSYLLDKYANFRRAVTCLSLEELRELFIQLALDLADYVSVKSSGKSALIEKVVAYIQENYANDIGLNDIAQSVYLSPAYLSTLVTSETGKDVVDLLNEIRVERATELLYNPSLKISDVAYAVGYREPQYFSVVFKKIKGLTPRNFRELNAPHA